MQDRPALKILIPYVLGIIIADRFKLSIPILWTLIIISTSSLLLTLIAYKKRWLSLSSVLIGFILICAGSLRYSISTTPPLQLNALMYKDVRFNGIVLENQIRGSRSSLIAKGLIFLASDPSVQVNAKILIRAWDKEDDIFRFEYGDVVEVTGKLSRPGFPRNPDMFDYRKYCERMGIFVGININKSSDALHLGNSGSPLILFTTNLYKKISAIIDESLPQFTIYDFKPERAISLLKGMTFGEYVPKSDAYVTTNTMHILVVSGSNFGIISLWTFYFSEFFRKRLTKLLQVRNHFLNTSYISYMLIIPVITLYTLIVGPQYPTTRAFIFVLMITIARLIDREPDLTNVIALSALIILLQTPGALMMLSFQLSFLAVGAIAYLMQYWSLITERIRRDNLLSALLYRATQVVFVSLSAQVATFPIIAHAFGKFSTIGFIANVVIFFIVLIVVPLSFVIPLVGLIGLLWFGKILGWFDYTLIFLLDTIVNRFANIPYASISVPNNWFSLPMVSIYAGIVILMTQLVRRPIIKEIPLKGKVLNLLQYIQQEAGARGVYISQFAKVVRTSERTWKINDYGCKIEELRQTGHDNLIFKIFKLVPMNRLYLVKSYSRPLEGGGKEHLIDIYLLKNRFTTTLIALTLIVFMIAIAYDGRVAKVTFLDVGQGDSAFVEMPGGPKILIDGGPKKDDFDGGRAVVVPFLNRKGIKKIDLVVATHPDNDHIGGLTYTIDKINVGKVLTGSYGLSSPTYEELLKRISEIEHYDAQLETIIYNKDMRIESLNTGYVNDIDENSQQMNNNSVVLRISYKDISFLFTGDIEVDGQERLLACGRDFRANVIKVPHHGSYSALNYRFIDAVSPNIAVISVGRKNEYGHPSYQVVNAYRSIGARVLRTDYNGAVTVITDGKYGWVRAMSDE